MVLPTDSSFKALFYSFTEYMFILEKLFSLLDIMAPGDIINGQIFYFNNLTKLLLGMH